MRPAWPTRSTAFVVFAEMRTGSNFLEANLNAFDGVTCHGEAFNPHFIGYPNRDEILGITQAERDADPAAAAATDPRAGRRGWPGSAIFHDHDPRVLATLLADPRCAKIVLTRNPVDSYVSWKIAQADRPVEADQCDASARTAQAHFDAAEFEAHLDALQAVPGPAS